MPVRRAYGTDSKVERLEGNLAHWTFETWKPRRGVAEARQ